MGSRETDAVGLAQCYELLSMAGQALRSAAQGQEWEGGLSLQTVPLVSLHHSPQPQVLGAALWPEGHTAVDCLML